jgi:hemolysin activation/secretion protein
MLIIVGIPRAQTHVNLSVDNSGSKYIGPWTANAHIDVADTIGPFTQTSLSLSTDFENELKNIEISQLIPLNSDGIKMVATAGYTKGHPGFTLEPEDVHSDTLRLGLGAGWDVIRQRTQNLNIFTGLDYQNADTDVLGGFPFVRDHTRTLKVFGHFDNQDRYAGTSVLEGTLSHGLDILGASQPNDPLLSRLKGRPDYTKIEASAYRYQNIDEDWNAIIGATGQYSATPLLSAQEFGFGGQAFGRAYDPSELVGDQGVGFKTEIRYDGLIDLYDGRHAQPYAFYDIGKIWNLDLGEPPADSAASAGLGLRYPLPYNLGLDFSLAQPLTRKADAPQYGNGNDPRFVMFLSGNFTH